MKHLTATIAALLLSASAYAQTREVTDSGVFVSDASGRYVRLEGRDGVIVNYLYDTPGTTQTSGIAVRVSDKLTLTVRYGGGKTVVAGLPKLTAAADHEGRTTAVTANEKTVALLDYTQSGYVAAVTLPGHLTWKLSPPDASHQVRQSVENATGQTVAKATVTTRIDRGGIRRGAAWDAVAPELGVALASVTWQRSPTGALTTGRDAEGRVVVYVVHTDRCDAGFSPDGTPRFYDLTLSVLGGHIPPGGDVVVSPAWEGQRATIPDHLVLTAGGTAGLYIEEPASHSIFAAWTDREEQVHTAIGDAERIAPPR